MSDLAKKQVAADSKEDFLQTRITRLENENKSLSDRNAHLTEQVDDLRQKNADLNSVKGDIAFSKLRSERDNLQKQLDKVLEFIKLQGLWEKLQEFLRPNARGQRR